MSAGTPSADAQDLARARAALAQAMQLAREFRERGVAVEHKEGGSPVTEADRAIDRYLRSFLPFEGDGWLSEETPDDAERLDRRRVWVVDPLDGTRSFVAGRPDYSVSIALLVDREPVLGAIGCPPRGVTVVGGRGHGVEVEGDPRLDWPEHGGRPRVLASRSEMKRGEWQHLDADVELRPVGSVAYKLALVAGGFADGTWTRQPKHEWDVAAGAALVRAAGGEVWLPRGGHLRWNRSSPRFLSFAAAGPGRRRQIEALDRPPTASS